jgi:hypothetical protein
MYLYLAYTYTINTGRFQSQQSPNTLCMLMPFLAFEPLKAYEHKNSLLLVLECRLSTTCLLLSCTAGKLRSNFISLATTAFIQLCSYTDSWYINTVMLFILHVHASLLEFIRAMKQKLIHETMICYVNMTAERAVRQEIITCFVMELYCRNALWRNYTEETLYEEE